MKVLYNNFQDLTWIKVFHKLNELYNFEPGLIIDKLKFINKSKNVFPNSSFFDMDECLLGFNKKGEEYLNIINHRIFKAHRNIAYDLLSRFSTNNGKSFTDQEKEELYHKAIIFWYNYLRKKNFDIFICKLAPHHFYDYIIYLCCKILKIKTLFFSGTIIKYHFLLKSKINNRSLIGYEKFRSEHQKNKTQSKFNNKNFLNDYINDKYINKKPWYIKKYQFLDNDFNKYIIKSYLRLIINFFRLSFMRKSDFLMKKPKMKLEKPKIFFSKFDYDRYIIDTTNKKKKLFQFYNKISTYPDLKKRFVFFAAAYQPELSSSPAGGNFQDHFRTLSLIDKNLPNDCLIYYKEHPTIFHPDLYMMGDIKRSEEYYRSLLTLKKLKFINIEQDSLDLIQNSLSTITISGEVGFEALIENRPSIVFSKTWYSSHNSVFYANNEESFKKALNNILNKNYNFYDKNIFFDFFLKNALQIKPINDGGNLNKDDILNICYCLSNS